MGFPALQSSSPFFADFSTDVLQGVAYFHEVQGSTSQRPSGVLTSQRKCALFTKPLESKEFFRMRDIIMNVPVRSAYMNRVRRMAACVSRLLPGPLSED